MKMGLKLKVSFTMVAAAGLGLIVWLFFRANGAQLAGGLQTVPLGKPVVAPRMVGNFGRVIIVAADGTLWGWGDSMQGELGVRTNKLCSLRLINGDPCWKEAATGSGFTLALRTNGTLWIWGAGKYAGKQSPDPCQPTQFGSDTNWSRVAAGAGHGIAQKFDGTLWTWGYNNEGQLGDGTTSDSKDPIQIGSGPWKTFAAGEFHAAAIAADGTLWDWGRRSPGGATALAQVDDETNWVAVYSGEFHMVAGKRDGSWWIWGDNAAFLQAGAATSPVRIQGTQVWVSVAGGNTHTLALGNDGSLWGVGRNSQGEVGDGTLIGSKSPVAVGSATNWIAIAATGNSSAGMMADGKLLVWGVRLDVPPRTVLDFSPRSILSRLLRFLKGRSSLGSVKHYSHSTQPVAVMQFQRVEDPIANDRSVPDVSQVAPPLSEH
jgi:alpha-tubulin suppressor-like RCC1 family protein